MERGERGEKLLVTEIESFEAVVDVGVDVGIDVDVDVDVDVDSIALHSLEIWDGEAPKHLTVWHYCFLKPMCVYIESLLQEYGIFSPYSIIITSHLVWCAEYRRKSIVQVIYTM